LIILAVGVAFGYSCKQESLSQNKSSEAASAPSVLRIANPDSINYLMGKFSPEKHTRFVKIAAKYADRPGMVMRERAYLAFIKMYNAAQADGVKLVIRSATRNFDYQKGIWEKKWTGSTILSNGINAAAEIKDPNSRALEILKYSAMPGTSRHHWGTDIDLNNFNNAWFESGEGLILFEWLEKNASAYGFCRPYSAKGESRPNGYNEEKWHWSYTPLANKFTNYAAAFLQDTMITGFLGSETAISINVVKNYVLGIAPACKS
jgi:LAS superfamily LD-carboxypeptidase LdcB